MLAGEILQTYWPEEGIETKINDDTLIVDISELQTYWPEEGIETKSLSLIFSTNDYKPIDPKRGLRLRSNQHNNFERILQTYWPEEGIETFLLLFLF